MNLLNNLNKINKSCNKSLVLMMVNKPNRRNDEEEDADPKLDLMEALWEQSSTEYDEDTQEALRNADPTDIAQAYLDYRAENNHELTSDETSGLYDVVGGQEQYTNMLRWAADNCDEQTIEMYDAVMSKGDLESCFFAVHYYLAFRMAEMEGWQPDDFLSGRSPIQTADVFRSQAEVVEAMNDPRYDRDPAYRQDIMNKLERSTELMY